MSKLLVETATHAEQYCLLFLQGGQLVTPTV